MQSLSTAAWLATALLTPHEAYVSDFRRFPTLGDSVKCELSRSVDKNTTTFAAIVEEYGEILDALNTFVDLGGEKPAWDNMAVQYRLARHVRTLRPKAELCEAIVTQQKATGS